MLLIVSLPLMAVAEDDPAAVADTASEPVAEEVQDAETPADPSVPEKAEEPAAGDAPVVVAGEAGDAPEEPAVEVKAGDTPAPAVAQTAVAEEPTEDIMPLEAVVNGAVVTESNDAAVPEAPVMRMGLRAVPAKAASVDNSTSLPDGEYLSTDYKFTFTNTAGEAKEILKLESIVVSNGKATGNFSASNDHKQVYYLGHYEDGMDTGSEGFVPITNRQVSFPVALNSNTNVSVEIKMGSKYKWVNYIYNIAIDESQEITTDTYSVSFNAVDKDTGSSIDSAQITVKDADGKAVNPDSQGLYTLEKAKYTLTATAQDYEDATEEHIPTQNETHTVRMKHVEVVPEGTTVFKEDTKDPSKTNLFNTTAMFKVIKGTLVNNGDKSTLTIVLNGKGYHHLFKGTYEQCLAGGVDESKWIAGKTNSDGKWEFVIPISATETFIPIVAISNSHLEKVKAGEETLGDAIFARQLVIDPKAVTLTAGDYDAVIDIQVISKSDVFKADSKGTMEVIGGPNSNNYACKPVITMLDSLYDKAFIGTAEEAAKAGSDRIKISGGKFAFSFTNSFGEDGRELTFEDKKPIAVAFYDTKDGKWIDHKLTIDKAAATVTIESLAEGEAPPEKPAQPDKDKNKDASNTTTKKVDNSTGLADGTYKPDSFSFSGGTGKVRIVCDSIEIKGGKAFATIRFVKKDGSPASVDMLRASGKTYSGDNKFTIPVKLNKNNKIVARTTAMSQPHWVEYMIYVGLDAAGDGTGGAAVGDNTADFDTEAPAIPGLKAVGEVETPFSDLVTIFEYEEGYYLIELDAVRDTARDTVEYRTQMEKERSVPTEEAKPEEAVEGEEEAADAAAEAKASDVLKNEIVKYLVVPEGKDVPAGIDGDVLIIKQPVENGYIASADALAIITELGKDGCFTTAGFEDETLAGGREFAGLPTEWDLKAMLIKETDFAVQPSDVLPVADADVDAAMEALITLADRAGQMDMAMFIDRSADEQTELGRAEWYKVYGAIFGAMDKADELYKKAVDGADENAKKEAEELLAKRAEERTAMIKEARDAAEA
ncbi:MAG: hypothetical protein IJH51_04250 [Christensenellaceae bacterium]|nr:hypothetical protein [Christensenellaceae bacterium]